MSVFVIQVLERESYAEVKNGYVPRELKKLSFDDLLARELIARTWGPELKAMAKEAFEKFARAENVSAAIRSLEVVYVTTVTTQDESPASLRLSVEDFHALRRNEQAEFFVWVESLFFSLQLYVSEHGEDRNCNEWFVLSNPLVEVKQWIYLKVAHIWKGQTDELGLKAFEFLMDCSDRWRFQKRAPEIVEAVHAYQQRHRLGYVPFSISRDEEKYIPEVIRAALPAKVEVITAWLERFDRTIPDAIRKLFGHAFINAGGEVVTSKPQPV